MGARGRSADCTWERAAGTGDFLRSRREPRQLEARKRMTRTPRPIRMRMMGRTMLRPLAGLALSVVGGRWSVVEVDSSRLTVDRAGSAGSAAVVAAGAGSAAVVVAGAGS